MAKIAKAEKVNSVRQKRLDKLAGICKVMNNGNFGGTNKDAVNFFGGGDDSRHIVERFSTGSIPLDESIGGGWPIGRICEIYGPFSGGKSTMCYHALAEFQKKFPDFDIALIDTEHSFDIDYARTLGVDVDLLLIHQPESGEQALNIADSLIEAGIKMIIVDSVAGLSPEKELEGDIGDSHIAQQARLMSQALRKLAMKVKRNNSFMLFTNQIRDLINVSFGAKTTTPGGNALKFWSSVRIEIRRIGSDKEGEIEVSNKIQTKCTKNKTFPPFRKADFNITFGIGVDSIAAILDDAINKKIVKKSGAWMKIGGETIAQGRAAFLNKMREEPEFLKQIEDLCKAPPENDDKKSDDSVEDVDKSSSNIRKQPVVEENNEDDKIEVEVV